MKNLSNNLNWKYSKGVIAIHWISAILLVGLFFMGKHLTYSNINIESKLVKVHAFIGVFVLLLTLVRIYLLLKNKTPKLKTGNKWNDIFMKFIHYGFYVIIICICISGIVLMKTESLEVLKVHSILASALALFFILHIIGIIKHLIFKKENAFRRIT